MFKWTKSATTAERLHKVGVAAFIGVAFALVGYGICANWHAFDVRFDIDQAIAE
jgi:hypothetical protein